MLTFSTDYDSLLCHCDEEDVPTTPEKIVEALANSIDVDFMNVENDGAPVALGNSYAQYEVSLLLPKFGPGEYIFGIGPMESDALNKRHCFEIEAIA